MKISHWHLWFIVRGDITKEFEQKRKFKVAAAAAENEGAVELSAGPTITQQVFTYTSDFDGKGLLYWIGTQGGTSSYFNPHKAGFVYASLSSIHKGVPDNIVEHTNSGIPCYTKNEQMSWVQVDLGRHRKFLPNYYTIRHGALGRGHAVRTWDLVAKENEPDDWIILKRHEGDTSLNHERESTASWPIELTITDPDFLGYRFFRIVQTSKNSGDNNCLFCGGLEFYGKLSLKSYASV
jgi:hypothetical protein